MDEEPHISGTDARAGSSEHVVRYVLSISLVAGDSAIHRDLPAAWLALSAFCTKTLRGWNRLPSLSVVASGVWGEGNVMGRDVMADPGDAAVEAVPLPDDEFKTQLAQVIPHLRAFGRSLSGSRDSGR